MALALSACGFGGGEPTDAEVAPPQIRAEHPVRSPGAPPETAPNGRQFDAAILDASDPDAKGAEDAPASPPSEGAEPADGG